MKRKQPDSGRHAESSTPKRKRTNAQLDGHAAPKDIKDITHSDQTAQPSSSQKSSSKKQNLSKRRRVETHDTEDDHDELGSPTPKANGKTVLNTPSKLKNKETHTDDTPARAHKADRSAKRKSATALLENQEEDDWDDDALAREILDDEDDEAFGQEHIEGAEAADTIDQAETPSKRGRGRPKGSKNRRSPTPDGDLPPEERYFFQNRSGPPHVSNNTLASLKLLTHDEYFDQIRNYKDHHEPEKKYLMKLHSRAFPQWRFEMSEGFNLCLYGWGSKRQLMNEYAEWLCRKSSPPPKIVVVNGYTTKLNIRAVLSTVASIMTEDDPIKLAGQPSEMLELILSHLSNHPPTRRIMVMINSIDASPLRRAATQLILARLGACPSIHLVATVDTPTFSLMWNTALRDQLNFVFHDCTTYEPYDAELSIVDDVHELLGRKGRRIGGKEGVGFVLKSLPENARSLYRVLLTEILSVLSDGVDNEGAPAEDEDDGEANGTRKGPQVEGDVGIEYRVLYQKASEEFICSSEMNFRTLLKEFHDHQMIVTRRDASGTEILGVPLGREEMEGVLEDLVVG